MTRLIEIPTAHVNGNGGFTLGSWLVEPALNRVTRNAECTYLRPQVMQVLTYLASHRGQVVSSDDLLNELWSGKVVTSGSVYTCIAELRQVLDKAGDSHVLIETIPKKGYRLKAPTDRNGAETPNSDAQAGTVEAAGLAKTRRRRLVLPGVLLLLMGIALLAIRGGPIPPPVVSTYQQLSTSQILFPPVPSPFPLVADESRLYFNDWISGRLGVRQLAQGGGEAVPIQSPFEDPEILINPQGISPDSTDLLISSFLPGSRAYPVLWLWPITGGTPRRLGEGASAVFSPDGKQLLYEKRGTLYLANPDMSEPQELVSVAGRAYWPIFSPDGETIRFTLANASGHRIYEVAADGTGLAPLLPEWVSVIHCCGVWTPDGDYFVFQATVDFRTQLWSMAERTGWLQERQSTPRQITTGGIDFRRPTIASDGNKIFAIGWQLRGEVSRFDAETGRFHPLPAFDSVSAEWLSYSRDGQWVSYTTYPEGTLWRSKNDGTERLQLTFSPMVASQSAWSADGQSIAFEGTMPGQAQAIYRVSLHGGEVSVVSKSDKAQWSPSWSASGNSIVFHVADNDELQRVDVDTGRTSIVTGATDLEGVQHSPTHNSLAGFSDNRLFLLDVESGERTELASTGPAWRLQWSADGRFIYVQEPFWRADERTVHRVSIDDGAVESIARIGDTRLAWGVDGMWIGIAPDDSPLVLRDLSIHHLYALEWR